MDGSAGSGKEDGQVASLGTQHQSTDFPTLKAVPPGSVSDYEKYLIIHHSIKQSQKTFLVPDFVWDI